MTTSRNKSKKGGQDAGCGMVRGEWTGESPVWNAGCGEVLLDPGVFSSCGVQWGGHCMCQGIGFRDGYRLPLSLQGRGLAWDALRPGRTRQEALSSIALLKDPGIHSECECSLSECHLGSPGERKEVATAFCSIGLCF